MGITRACRAAKKAVYYGKNFGQAKQNLYYSDPITQIIPLLAFFLLSMYIIHKFYYYLLPTDKMPSPFL